MNRDRSPLVGRITATATATAIIPAVSEPIEITLILAPGGDISVFHQQSGGAGFASSNQIIGPEVGNVVYQSQAIGTGITLDKGDSLGVSSSASKAVSVYGSLVIARESQI